MRGDALARIVPLLVGAQKGGSGYLAYCPAHDDGAQNRERSLSVDQGTVGAVVKCFAGCPADAIVSRWGMTLADLYDERSGEREKSKVPSEQREKVTLRVLSERFRLSVDHLRSLGLREAGEMVEIPYYDERGKVAIKRWRVRVLTPGAKVVSPKAETTEKHGWGVVPYGLDDLPRIREKPVPSLVLVEGESDVWVLRWYGVPCLGIPGATAYKCLTADHLVGVKRLFLVRESDEAGEKFVRGVAGHVRGLGFTGDVRVVTELPAKDVADLHRADPDGFRQSLATALRESVKWGEGEFADESSGEVSPNVMDRVFALGTRERKPIEFLWRPRIVSGALTILAAHPGAGKSFLVASLVADLTSGRKLPGEDGERSPSSVLVFAAEDDPASVLRPRIEDAGGNVDRVFCYDLATHPFAFDGDGVSTTRALIDQIKPSLVVFDPLVTFLAEKVDMKSQNSVRAVLQPLIALAGETGVPFLLVAHARKGESASNVADSIMGSIDFSAAPRSAMVIMPDPDLEDGVEGGILVHAKKNYSARAESLRFRIVTTPGEMDRPRFEWAGRCWASVAQLQARARESAHERPQLTEAVAIIRRELVDGPKSVKYLRSRLTAHGVAPAMLFAARAQAGVVTVDLPTGEVGWQLPASDAREEDVRRSAVASSARSRQAEIETTSADEEMPI